MNVSDPRVIVTETEMGERELISNLTINDVLPSDSNVYRCIAENDVDSDMRNATLTVNGESVFCYLHTKIQTDCQLHVVLFCHSVASGNYCLS